MVTVTKHGVLLDASKKDFENRAVLNPTCVQKGKTIHLFYRAVNEKEHSSIGYCKLNGPLKIVRRSKRPVVEREFDYESFGVEDPRITFLDGKYYLFYSAYDGKVCRIAYAVSKDLKKWKKKGVISSTLSYDEAGELLRNNKNQVKERYFFFQEYIKNMVGKDVGVWDKDASLLPKKINGKYAMIHRVLPEIQIAYFNKFSELKKVSYWKKYFKDFEKNVVLEPGHDYESRNIGAGAPLIKTELGWLMIYHAVQDTNDGIIYHASAALLDLKDPTKLIGRLEEPLFSPKEKYELTGEIDDVVFPTGTAQFGDKLYIYYGAADRKIAVASVNLTELLAELDESRKIDLVAKAILNCAKKGLYDSLEILRKEDFDDKIYYMALGLLVGRGKITLKKSKDTYIIELKK